MLQKVFEPFTVRNLTIRNRLVVPAMVTNYCNEDGTATERYIAYHETKAKGGFGLIITEDYAVLPSGRAYKYVAGLWNDDQIAGHSELTKRVHQHGAQIFAQIYHCGRQTRPAIIGETPIAPSPIASHPNVIVPRELSGNEIEKIIEAFGDTALRALKCGFDGVQLHGTHGYLISQFMSPSANKRVDLYGGNLRNRLRFVVKILRNIREKCGDKLVIDFRISSDELISGGLGSEDIKTIALILQDEGIDMLHVSRGTTYSNRFIIPPQYVPHGVLAVAAGEIRQLLNIPVTTVGRVNDLYIAEEMLHSEKADLIAMGRQSLCDPYTPNKAREGRFEEIRQCIACNFGCSEQINRGEPMRCVLNPGLGLEYTLEADKATIPRMVAVIGGGPAGMQAAITAAERGHQVTLFEKNPEFGGQFRIAAYPPSKGELTGFTVWQKTMMEKLRVNAKVSTEATPENLGDAEAVVLATGGSPIRPRIPGVDGPNVVFAEDLLSGKLLPGLRVVVIGGGQVGAETADYLTLLNRKVVLIEMLEDIAIQESAAPRWFLLDSLEDAGVQIHTCTKVERLEDNKVVTACGKEFEADTIVLAVGVKSENGLKRPLEEAGYKVHVIGDAEKVRNVMAATQEGFQAGRAI